MTRMLLILPTILFAAQVLCASRTARADDASAEREAVESGRRSLTRRTSYPWYDPDKDALRRIDLPDETADDDPGNRNSRWEVKPSTASSPPLRGDWAAGIGQLVQGMLWILLGLVLVAVVALLVWAFLRREVKDEKKASTVETSREVDRLEELPFAVKRPQSDLLAEARRLYEAGKFAEAIIYLFSFELVELDKHQVIRLTKGKTNRQYLGEARGKPAVLPLLEDTMVAFEDVFFGKHGLDRERFESCWRRVDEFRRGLQGGIA